MKVAVLYSGGKDSNYALYKASQDHEISCLITLQPINDESLLFHYPNVWITTVQASILEIPQIFHFVENDELSSLYEVLSLAKKEYAIEGVVTGGIKSKFQYDKFGRVFENLDIKVLAPIWGVQEDTYLNSLIDEGFKFVMVSVSALGLGKEWLGKEFDRSMVNRFLEMAKRYRFNPSLEGGEGETLVLDMPLFKKKLVILDSHIVWYKDRGMLKIDQLGLREKERNV